MVHNDVDFDVTSVAETEWSPPAKGRQWWLSNQLKLCIVTAPWSQRSDSSSSRWLPVAVACRRAFYTRSRLKVCGHLKPRFSQILSLHSHGCCSNLSLAQAISWNLTSRCLAVTGGGNVHWCRQLMVMELIPVSWQSARRWLSHVIWW